MNAPFPDEGRAQHIDNLRHHVSHLWPNPITWDEGYHVRAAVAWQRHIRHDRSTLQHDERSSLLLNHIRRGMTHLEDSIWSVCGVRTTLFSRFLQADDSRLSTQVALRVTYPACCSCKQIVATPR